MPAGKHRDELNNASEDSLVKSSNQYLVGNSKKRRGVGLGKREKCTDATTGRSEENHPIFWCTIPYSIITHLFSRSTATFALLTFCWIYSLKLTNSFQKLVYSLHCSSVSSLSTCGMDMLLQKLWSEFDPKKIGLKEVMGKN